MNVVLDSRKNHPFTINGVGMAVRLNHLIASAGFRLLAVILAFFLLALIALYWPLFNTATHLSGQTGDVVTDYFHFYWNFWWVRHALAAGQTIYETNYVFAPFTSSLVYHTLTVFWYPLWALLEPLFGTINAMLAVFLASLTLCGFSLYLLLRRQGVSPALAFVGGAMLELTPAMFNGVYWTNINIMGWFWLPFMLLLWGELARRAHQLRPAIGLSLLLGVLLWAMLLTDLQYPIFASFLIVPYVLWTLYHAPGLAARLRLIALGLLALCLALLLLGFIGPLPALLAFQSSGLAPTPVERAVSIPFPQGFFQRLPEDVSVGSLLLPLVFLALLLNRFAHPPSHPPAHRGLGASRAFWFAVMLLPLIMAAGGSITVGSLVIPLPYTILHSLFNGQFRYPERFIPVMLIPAVLFIMLTLTPLLRRRFERYLVPSLLLILLAADSWLYRPEPIQPIPRHYNFYDTLAQESLDYVIIESPTGASTGESLVGEQRFAALQWYGIFHGKRMINGHISRADVNHFYYMRTDDPLLAWLGQRRFLEPDLVEPQLRRIIPEWPVGYIVIHQDLIGRSGPTTQEIIGYLNTLDDLLCPVWVEHDAVVYRTAWHPTPCPPRTPPEVEPGLYRIDLGASGDERFIGWGWHWPEPVGDITTWRWTGEYPQTRLYIDLPPAAYQLTFTAQAFYEPRQLTLLLDGAPLTSEPFTVLPDSLQTFTVALPIERVGQGHHLTLTLDYDAVRVPLEVGQSADERRLAIAVDWMEFRRQP